MNLDLLLKELRQLSISPLQNLKSDLFTAEEKLYFLGQLKTIIDLRDCIYDIQAREEFQRSIRVLGFSSSVR